MEVDNYAWLVHQKPIIFLWNRFLWYGPLSFHVISAWSSCLDSRKNCVEPIPWPLNGVSYSQYHADMQNSTQSIKSINHSLNQFIHSFIQLVKVGQSTNQWVSHWLRIFRVHDDICGCDFAVFSGVCSAGGITTFVVAKVICPSLLDLWWQYKASWTSNFPCCLCLPRCCRFAIYENNTENSRININRSVMCKLAREGDHHRGDLDINCSSR